MFYKIYSKLNCWHIFTNPTPTPVLYLLEFPLPPYISCDPNHFSSHKISLNHTQTLQAQEDENIVVTDILTEKINTVSFPPKIT